VEDSGDTTVSDDSDNGDDDSELFTESTVDDDTKEVEVNYEDIYKDIFDNPIKANGTEFQVKSVEEARRLMQQGLGFHRKNKEYKEAMPIMTMLKNNGIDQNKLNFAIDLLNGNQDAIKKLLSDAELDPLELDLEENIEYNPNNYSVPENELKIQEVLDDIKSSPKFDETIDLFSGNKWDKASVEKASDNPIIISTINSHKEAGIFDKVQAEVDRLRILGTISSAVSDLDAYEAVGIEMEKKGLFAEDTNNNNQQETQSKNPLSKQIAESLSKNPVTENNNNNKRAAAGIPNTQTNSINSGSTDPFELSDEEFEKQFGNMLPNI